MKNISKAFFCVIFVVFQIPERAFKSIDGDCPNPGNVENLNMEKMLGTWYIIEDDNRKSNSHCSILKFKKQFNQFSIEKCNIKDDDGFNCFEYANLTISDRISAQFNKNLLQRVYYSDFSFHVIITDYNTYAGILFCNQEFFESFYIQSLMILSRNDVLNPQYLKKITSKFTELKIETGELRPNIQDKCSTSTTENNKISFDIYLISLLIVMIFK